MSKIAIATDSRGTMGAGDGSPWTTYFKETSPQHDVFNTLWQRASFTSIFDHLPVFLKSGQFDIGIIQLGYHDYVIPWIKTCLKNIKPFDADYEKYLTPHPEITLAGHTFKNTFNYRHDEAVKKCFEQIRTHCKKLIFIQMPYSWEEFKERTIMMNVIYSSFCDTSIALPMDSEFPKLHTAYSNLDMVHYTPTYSQYLAGLVTQEVNKTMRL
jgi:hypothetical protein